MTAAAEDGRGHANRGLAIAEALGERGWRTELQLIRGSLSAIEADRARSAGATILAASAPPASGVVVVDLPDPNHNPGAVAAERLVVFDDSDLFAGTAAIVVQPSQAAWTGRGRAGLILAGPDAVPIGAAFRRLRPRVATTSRTAEGCLVVACFGGSDPARVGERLAPALRPDPGWRTELILGAGYAGPTDGWPVDIIRDPPDLPARLAAADLVVLGAGTMKFEAACLGRAALLLAVADDQLTAGPAFAQTGAASYLGDGRSVAPETVRGAIDDLVRDPRRRSAMSRRALEVVDGRGAERIAEAIARLATARGE